MESRIQQEIQRVHFSQESLEQELDKWKACSETHRFFVSCVIKTPFDKTIKSRHPGVEFSTVSWDRQVRFGSPARFAGQARLYEFGVRFTIIVTPIRKDLCDRFVHAKLIGRFDLREEVSSFNANLQSLLGQDFCKKELEMAGCSLGYVPDGDYFKVWQDFTDHAYDRYEQAMAMEVLARVASFNDPGCPEPACFIDPSTKF